MRDDGNAALVELSSLPLAHNFGDTLRAYAEAYHAKIHLADAAPAEHAGEGIASAHDRVAFLHTILPGDADPDERPRGLFVDSAIEANNMLRPLAAYVPGAEPDRGVAGGEGWRIEKGYALEDDALVVSFRVEGARMPSAIETEINLAMPSCDGFGGRYVLADGSVPGGFGETLMLAEVTQLRLEDSELRGALCVEATQPVTIEAHAHRTVSQSEAGFEKIMQAVCLTLAWSPAAGEQRIALRSLPAS